tara:strand:- start:19 stop:627 length:609 start_codon:yes stop_codon:yes gene_type:complete
MKSYYQDDYVTIYHADCRDILPDLPKVDLVLTDPPYGIDANKMTLGSGKHEFHRGTTWDSTRTVDIIRTFLLMANEVAIFGGNYYSDILPANNKWLVWHKLNDGLSFSEAELIWTNYAPNIRVYSKYVAGRQKQHPTEKPIELLYWCLSYSKANVVLDPFLGSGTTAVACKGNRKCIGIEIEEKYCEIAANRCRQSVFELGI